MDQPLYIASYSILYFLAVAIPAAQILHRTGYSRWLALLAVIPLLGTIGLRLFAFSEGPADISAWALVVLIALLGIIGLWIVAFVQRPTIFAATRQVKKELDDPSDANKDDVSLRHQSDDSYPPYNMVRTGKNSFRISLAVPGFRPDRIDVTVHQNTLIVSGREAQQSDLDYLHQGITTRAFERCFSLAEFVEVKGATLEDGLLQIDLAREIPEALKPRRIEVSYPTQRPRADWTRPATVRRIHPSPSAS